VQASMSSWLLGVPLHEGATLSRPGAPKLAAADRLCCRNCCCCRTTNLQDMLPVDLAARLTARTGGLAPLDGRRSCSENLHTTHKYSKGVAYCC
jgi:hypothetical protein